MCTLSNDIYPGLSKTSTVVAHPFLERGAIERDLTEKESILLLFLEWAIFQTNSGFNEET